MSNILQGLQNKPFQAFKDIISMRNSPSLGEVHDNEPKHFQSKDDSFNYLINMKIERFLSPEFQILKVIKNKNTTLIITKKVKKKTEKEVIPFVNTIEIIVTENIYNQNQGRIRYHLLNRMLLNIEEANISSEELNSEENPLTFFHICQKFIIINSKSKVIIADYNNHLYSTIFTKTPERSIQIFYSYDELVGIDGKILNRSYVFGHNHLGDIYYFTIDDDSFENTEDLKKMNIVMKKLSLCWEEKIKDLKVIKIYSSQEKRWFYLVCYLREKEFVYYISDFVKCSLQTILDKIYARDTKIHRNVIDLQENKFKMKKIFDFYNQTGVCSIIIANGDDIILIEYDSGFTPLRMKQLLEYGTIDSQRKNLGGNTPTTHRENKMIPEDLTKYFAFSLHQYSIDYDNYAVMYEKHKLCFVSKKQIILTNINRGQNYYLYTLKDDDQFVEFFKYDGIQHLFVYTNKKIFRFRFIFRFKTILDINKALKEIQTNHANEKNNRIQRLDKFQNFDLKEYDAETYEKCICFLNIYIEQVKRKSPTCFYCMLKGEITCYNCKEFQYCSKLHQDCEWRLFHFFECNLLQLFTKVKEFGIYDSTSKIFLKKGFFYHNFKKYFGNILIELLKFCKDSIDCQEHLIYIHFLLEILERFDVLSFFKNIFIKVLNITKPETKDGKEKTSLQVDKAILLDTVFYYFSLRLFYSKFCMESQYYYVAYNNLSFLKDQMQILKQESSSKQLRNILNIRLSIQDIESVTPNFLKDDVYNLLSINKHNKTSIEEMVKNEKNQDASLYDKFFYFLTYFKSTVFKYNLKLDTKKEELLIPFIQDIVTIFDNTFQDNNVIFSYLYFYFCFYLVEDDKFYSAINLLNKTLTSSEEKNYELKTACLYNLGMLNYSVGNVNDGIHELEEAYRLNVNHNLSTNTLLQILDHLSLAYVDQKSFRKAYSLLQQSISMRSLSYDDKSIKETVKLKFFINFIIDYIEYNFTLDKKHSMWNTSANPHNKKFDYEAESENLIQYVLSNFTDVKQPLDLYTEEFLKLTEFLYNLTSAEIKFLNDDNNLKIDSKNQKEQQEHLISTQTLLRDSNRDQISQKDLNNDIEIKKAFFNNLSASKQEVLKTLNITLLKRNIVLRDSKGPIDHFNLNYHPIHTKTLQKIIDNIRSHFFVQEVSKTEVALNKFERNLHSSVLRSLYRYLDSQDINYAVVVEKFKLNPQIEDKNESKTKEISTNRSQKKTTRKMDYSIFLVHMMEKLEMQDHPDLINDLLYQVYNFLNEEEVNHMAKNPELLLNFIHNDTKVFEFGNDLKKNKGQELYEKLYQNVDEAVQTLKSQRRSNLLEKYPSLETEDIKKTFYKKIINFFSVQRKTKSSFNILNNDFTLLDESAKARGLMRRSNTLQYNGPKGNTSQTSDDSDMQNSISNISSNILNNRDKKKKSINLTENNSINRISFLRETPMKRSSLLDENLKFKSQIDFEEMNLRDPNSISTLNKNDHKLQINEFHNEDLDFFSNTIQKLKEISDNEKNKSLSKKTGNINLIKPNKKGIPKLESSTGELHISQTKIEYIKNIISPPQKNKHSSVDRETSTKKSPNFAQSSYQNESAFSNPKESKNFNDSSSFKDKNNSTSFKKHNHSQNDIECSPSKFSLKREFTLNQNKNYNKLPEEVKKFDSKFNQIKSPSEKISSPTTSEKTKNHVNKNIPSVNNQNDFLHTPSPIGILGKYMASKPVKNLNNSIHNNESAVNTGLNFVYNINKSLNANVNQSVSSQKVQSRPATNTNKNNNIKENNQIKLNPSTNSQGNINPKQPTQTTYQNRNKDNFKTGEVTNHSKEVNEVISNPPEKKFVNGGGVQYTVKRNSNEPKKNMNHNNFNNNVPIDSPLSSVDHKNKQKSDGKKSKNESVSTIETPFLKRYNETINSQRPVNTSNISQQSTLLYKDNTETNLRNKKTGKFGKEIENRDTNVKASNDTYFETRNFEGNSPKIIKKETKINKKTIISLKGYTKKNLNRSMETEISYSDFKKMKKESKEKERLDKNDNQQLVHKEVNSLITENKTNSNNTSYLNDSIVNQITKKNQQNTSGINSNQINITESKKFNLNVSKMNDSMMNITDIKRSNINTSSGVNENLTITNADDFFATKNNFSLKGDKPNFINLNKQSLQEYHSNNQNSSKEIKTTENLLTNYPDNIYIKQETVYDFKKVEGKSPNNNCNQKRIDKISDANNYQQENEMISKSKSNTKQVLVMKSHENSEINSLKMFNKIEESQSKNEDLQKNNKDSLSQVKKEKKKLEDYFNFDSEFKEKFAMEMPAELRPIELTFKNIVKEDDNQSLTQKTSELNQKQQIENNLNNLKGKDLLSFNKSRIPQYEEERKNQVDLNKKNINSIKKEEINIAIDNHEKSVNLQNTESENLLKNKIMSQESKINQPIPDINIHSESKEEFPKNLSHLNSNNYVLSDFSLNFDSNKPIIFNKHNININLNENSLYSSDNNQKNDNLDHQPLNKKYLDNSDLISEKIENIPLLNNLLQKHFNNAEEKNSNKHYKMEIATKSSPPTEEHFLKDCNNSKNRTKQLKIINEIIESSNSISSLSSESKSKKKEGLVDKNEVESLRTDIKESLTNEKEELDSSLGGVKSKMRNTILSGCNSLSKSHSNVKNSEHNKNSPKQLNSLNSNQNKVIPESFSKKGSNIIGNSSDNSNITPKQPSPINKVSDKQTSRFLLMSDMEKKEIIVHEKDNNNSQPQKPFNLISIDPLANSEDNNTNSNNILKNYNIETDKTEILEKTDTNNFIGSDSLLSNIVKKKSGISNDKNSCKKENVNNNDVSPTSSDPTIPSVPFNISNSNINNNSVPIVPNLHGGPKVPGIPGIPGGLPSVGMGLNKVPVKPKVKPNANMKPLYWNIIDPKKVSSTAWGRIDDSTVKIDSAKLEEEFSIKKLTVNDNKSPDKVILKTQLNSTLTSQRQQNINLVLSKAKMTGPILAEALKKYDLNRLSINMCELIIPILPTESEINSVKLYEDPSQLADCDKFVLSLANISGYDLRIKSIIFKHTYDQSFKELDMKITRVDKTLDFFKNDERVLEWLRIVLAYGNYLNGTSNRGGAFGFKLDSLNKLTELKSNDNKKTLISFIVESILDREKPEMFDIKMKENDEEEVFIANLQDLLRDIRKSFQIVIKLKDLSENLTDSEDKTREFLSSFFKISDEKISIFDKKIKEIEDNYESICQYYGENPKEMPYDQFIDVFNKFFQNIATTKANCLKQREILLRQQKKSK